jgi:uncharacterized phiE125 gp8 family phage protein
MMLNERTTVPDAALPVAEFRDHLRLGTGFADDAVQDARLAGCLRAAMAAVEGRTGKVLIARAFTWAVSRWRDAGGQPLPVAPVKRTDGDAAGAAVGRAGRRRSGALSAGAGPSQAAILPGGIVLPSIPTGGRIEVDFVAGFGPAWGEVSADLRQAVLMLAAQYYEARDGQTDMGELPMGVSALIARWRTLRTLGGGAR